MQNDQEINEIVMKDYQEMNKLFDEYKETGNSSLNDTQLYLLFETSINSLNEILEICDKNNGLDIADKLLRGFQQATLEDLGSKNMNNFCRYIFNMMDFENPKNPRWILRLSLKVTYPLQLSLYRVDKLGLRKLQNNPISKIQKKEIRKIMNEILSNYFLIKLEKMKEDKMTKQNSSEIGQYGSIKNI